jgi:hypothetical protein
LFSPTATGPLTCSSDIGSSTCSSAKRSSILLQYFCNNYYHIPWNAEKNCIAKAINRCFRCLPHILGTVLHSSMTEILMCEQHVHKQGYECTQQGSEQWVEHKCTHTHTHVRTVHFSTYMLIRMQYVFQWYTWYTIHDSCRGKIRA